MSVLHDVLDHLRAGRWNEAHQLVQSDDSRLSAWLHGILHLQGHDHEEDASASVMESLERAILGRMRIPDPYADRSAPIRG